MYEEEKGDHMIIDTTSAQKQEKLIKLTDEDERNLKNMIKVYDDSEILLRIFKLFNLFYEKFS
jgi:hypothetical protein